MEGFFKVTTGPATEPVTVQEVKTALNIDFADDDAYIGELIGVAREFLEANTNLALLTQTITHVLPRFPRVTAQNPLATIPLYKYPVQSITSISYHDENDAVQTIAVSGPTPGAELDSTSMPSQIFLKTANLAAWPTTYSTRLNPVTLVYVAGYANAGAVPKQIKQAIKLIVGEMYEKRENYVKEKLTAVDHLMRLVENRLY
jgi:uncharacterized phiE125 gp8 family phage protein